MLWCSNNQDCSCKSLGSSYSLLLARPGARTEAGDAAFPSAASVLWNNLPLVLRQIQDERSVC